LAVYLWVVHSFRAALAQPAIVVGLVGLFLSSSRLRVPAPLAWFGLFVLWAAISVGANAQGYASTEILSDYTKFWLIFLVACNAAQTRRQFYVLMIVWLGIFAVYPVRGTLVNFAIGNSFFGRYAWNFTFRNPNDLAALTLPVLAMSIAVLQGGVQARWIRFSAFAGIIILPLMIIITQSRGGILALATLGVLVLVQYRSQARGYAIAFVAFGVIALTAPPDVWERLSGLRAIGTGAEELSAVDVEGSAKQRFEIWKVAMAISKDNPIVGVGLGAYSQTHEVTANSSSFSRIARGQRDPHSMYFKVLAETGGIGLLIFLGMIASVFVSGRSALRKLAETDPASARQLLTLLFGLVAFLQAGLFATLNSIPYLYVYLGVITTATAVLSSTNTVRPKSPNRGWGGAIQGAENRRRSVLPATPAARTGVQNRPR
jgi:O-antigen ligase